MAEGSLDIAVARGLEPRGDQRTGLGLVRRARLGQYGDFDAVGQEVILPRLLAALGFLARPFVEVAGGFGVGQWGP